MCECGCSMNNETYRLPGPKGMMIERFKNEASLEKYAFELPPELPLEKWPESMGCAIITGFRKHEFAKSLKSGLVGLKSDEFADKPGAGLDEIAAETILEDLYDESTVTPHLAGERP